MGRAQEPVFLMWWNSNTSDWLMLLVGDHTLSNKDLRWELVSDSPAGTFTCYVTLRMWLCADVSVRDKELRHPCVNRNFCKKSIAESTRDLSSLRSGLDSKLYTIVWPWMVKWMSHLTLLRLIFLRCKIYSYNLCLPTLEDSLKDQMIVADINCLLGICQWLW